MVTSGRKRPEGKKKKRKNNKGKKRCTQLGVERLRKINAEADRIPFMQGPDAMVVRPAWRFRSKADNPLLPDAFNSPTSPSTAN